CPKPLCLHCTVAAPPELVVAAPCGRQSRCQGAATLAAGAVTPFSGRVSLYQLALIGWTLAPTPCEHTISGTTAFCKRLPLQNALVTADRPCKGCGRGRSPLQRA
ncbi:hypothetical protein BHE74_00054953, partial [Ensete ventricosum]